MHARITNLEIIGIIAVVCFLLAIAGTIVVSTWQIIQATVNYFFKDYINRYLLLHSLHPQSREFLEKKFRYYQQLNYKDRRIFRKRVQKFINMKEFVPRGELMEVTREMKTLIAASAIQITFGHPGIYFSHFYKIIVYPDNYYSIITRKYHRGEVNSRGYIVLSWKALVNGYLNDNDGRNLALHEMAHALKIADAVKNEEYNFMDTAVLNKFKWLGRSEMEKIVNGNDSFFRDYAAIDDYEFFAVAVENFFERTEQFENKHPEIFYLMVELLNQNPLTHARTNY